MSSKDYPSDIRNEKIIIFTLTFAICFLTVAFDYVYELRLVVVDVKFDQKGAGVIVGTLMLGLYISLIYTFIRWEVYVREQDSSQMKDDLSELNDHFTKISSSIDNIISKIDFIKSTVEYSHQQFVEDGLKKYQDVMALVEKISQPLPDHRRAPSARAAEILKITEYIHQYPSRISAMKDDFPMIEQLLRNLLKIAKFDWKMSSRWQKYQKFRIKYLDLLIPRLAFIFAIGLSPILFNRAKVFLFPYDDKITLSWPKEWLISFSSTIIK